MYAPAPSGRAGAAERQGAARGPWTERSPSEPQVKTATAGRQSLHHRTARGNSGCGRLRPTPPGVHSHKKKWLDGKSEDASNKPSNYRLPDCLAKTEQSLLKGGGRGRKGEDGDAVYRRLLLLQVSRLIRLQSVDHSECETTTFSTQMMIREEKKNRRLLNNFTNSVQFKKSFSGGD